MPGDDPREIHSIVVDIRDLSTSSFKCLASQSSPPSSKTLNLRYHDWWANQIKRAIPARNPTCRICPTGTPQMPWELLELLYCASIIVLGHMINTNHSFIREIFQVSFAGGPLVPRAACSALQSIAGSLPGCSVFLHDPPFFLRQIFTGLLRDKIYVPINSLNRY